MEKITLLKFFRLIEIFGSGYHQSATGKSGAKLIFPFWACEKVSLKYFSRSKFIPPGILIKTTIYFPGCMMYQKTQALMIFQLFLQAVLSQLMSLFDQLRCQKVQTLKSNQMPKQWFQGLVIPKSFRKVKARSNKNSPTMVLQKPIF